MLCKKPIRLRSEGKELSVPCGQCFNCRVNKGRKWTARLLMECQDHTDSIFVTLSYRPEKLPPGDNLVKADLQNYFKRLRHAGIKFRYFAVGEYGSTKGRSHYHVAMFGPTRDQVFGTNNYLPADGGHATHKDAYWEKGRVHIGDLNSDTARYIVGYTLKKLTDDHEAIVNGREKEFTLQSRRPPLGVPFITRAAEQVLCASRYETDPGVEAIRIFEAGSVRINQRLWPLDRQMLRTVYRTLGPSPDGPSQKITRASLRHTIGEWTGKNARDLTTAKTRADKGMRKLLHRNRTGAF